MQQFEMYMQLVFKNVLGIRFPDLFIKSTHNMLIINTNATFGIIQYSFYCTLQYKTYCSSKMPGITKLFYFDIYLSM